MSQDLGIELATIRRIIAQELCRDQGLRLSPVGYHLAARKQA